jgi:hypothetical protein
MTRSIQHYGPDRNGVHDHSTVSFTFGQAERGPTESEIIVVPYHFSPERASSNHTVLPVLPRRVPQRRAEQATS